MDEIVGGVSHLQTIQQIYSQHNVNLLVSVVFYVLKDWAIERIIKLSFVLCFDRFVILMFLPSVDLEMIIERSQTQVNSVELNTIPLLFEYQIQAGGVFVWFDVWNKCFNILV